MKKHRAPRETAPGRDREVSVVLKNSNSLYVIVDRAVIVNNLSILKRKNNSSHKKSVQK